MSSPKKKKEKKKEKTLVNIPKTSINKFLTLRQPIITLKTKTN